MARVVAPVVAADNTFGLDQARGQGELLDGLLVGMGGVEVHPVEVPRLEARQYLEVVADVQHHRAVRQLGLEPLHDPG